MKPLLADLADGLADLERRELRRRLEPPAGADFVSNDYLGLAGDPRLAVAVERRLAELAASGLPLGAPGSRLLRGHHEIHRRLEERWAAFRGTEAALLFPSGYQANVGLLTALIARCDRAISDELNHASLIDGLRLSGCHKEIVPHLDLSELERVLRTGWPGGRTFVVTESLFSMDGDRPDLAAIAALCAAHGAELLVDEAHATGLWGPDRRSGLLEELGLERRVTASVATCGKALGLAGAFVSGPRVLVDWLVNRCRPFVFSTAPAPLLLAGLEAALDVLAAEPDRGPRARALATRFRRRLRALGGPVADGDGPIVPVVLGSEARALRVAERIRAEGFDVRAVRPPTVPPGTSRLRISIHADHPPELVDALAAAVAEAIAAEPDGVGASGSDRLLAGAPR